MSRREPARLDVSCRRRNVVDLRRAGRGPGTGINATIAPLGEDRRRSGAGGRAYVIRVIAHHHRSMSGSACAIDDAEQMPGVGLACRERVSAADGVEQRGQFEFLQNSSRSGFRLVRAYGEIPVVLSQQFQNGPGSRKWLGQFCRSRAVERHETRRRLNSIDGRRRFRVPGFAPRERAFDQGGHAISDHCSHCGGVGRGHAVAVQKILDRSGHIGKGVDQRAVEIENNKPPAASHDQFSIQSQATVPASKSSVT